MNHNPIFIKLGNTYINLREVRKFRIVCTPANTLPVSGAIHFKYREDDTEVFHFKVRADAREEEVVAHLQKLHQEISKLVEANRTIVDLEDTLLKFQD